VAGWGFAVAEVAKGGRFLVGVGFEAFFKIFVHLRLLLGIFFSPFRVPSHKSEEPEGEKSAEAPRARVEQSRTHDNFLLAKTCERCGTGD
jgi:hypothetical protein